MAAPLSSKISRVGFIIEETAGTAGTPTAASLRTFNAQLNPNWQFTKRRPDDGFHGSEVSVEEARQGNMSFEVELAGSGNGASPVPAWAGLLTACGFVVSGDDSNIYTVTSSFGSKNTVTLGRWVGGKYRQLRGASGNVEFILPSRGIGKAKFSFDGIFVDQDDAAVPTGATRDRVTPPRFGGGTLTVDSVAQKTRNLQINTNNTLTPRLDGNSADGLEAVWVTDRDPGGSFDPEALAEGTHDQDGKFAALTQMALAVTLGSTEGNQIQFSAPKLQYLNPSEQDADGIFAYQIPFELHKDSGDDDLVITFPVSA